MEPYEKLSVLIPLKVSGSMARDIKKYAGGSRKRPEFVRESIADRILRAKAESAPKITKQEAQAIAECRALNIDPIPHLQAAIADAAPEFSPVPR